MGEWKAIESAPRDGTEFLAYWKPPGGGEAAVIIAKWTEDFGPRFVGLNVADGMGHRTSSPLTFGFDGGKLYATHWMPLPPPPQEGGEQQAALKAAGGE